MQLAGLVPNAGGWRRALQRLLLGLGLGLMLAGVICIVAYNWIGMGRAGRFALAQAAVLIVLALAFWRGFDRPDGQRLLTAAIVLVGPLLALFGQSYQTGADTWELFRTWVLLVLPWVLASRYAPAWLVWVALLEIGLALYWTTADLWNWRWFGVAPTWLLAAVLNIAVLMTWEAAGRRWAWLRGRTGPRAIAGCLLATLTVMTVIAVLAGTQLDDAESLVLAPLLWALVIAAGYLAYRVKAVELAMLAMGWLSLTIVLLAWLLRLTVSMGSPTLSFLLGALLLIGASAGGRHWLSKAATEGRS